MIVLAIDTAHAACAVCVYDSLAGLNLAKCSEPMNQGQAERLSGMVNEVLVEAGLKLSGIDRLAVCIGPGTFTGVRIGLAFARGLALVLKIPVVGITTFEVLAASARQVGSARDIWVVQDARRSEVYIQGFDQTGHAISDAEAMALSDAQNLLAGKQATVTGSGVDLLQLTQALTPSARLASPDIEQLARLAALHEPFEQPPSPLYLRAPDAKVQAPLVRHESLAITVSQISEQHRGLMAELHAAAFDRPWTEASIGELLLSPGCIGLLAVAGKNDGTQPVGLLIARKAADEMELLTIAVLPAMRRRGVAAALLARLHKFAAKAGASVIHLEWAAGNIAAAALYESAGYCPTGTRKNYYHRADGSREDAITASLRLSE